MSLAHQKKSALLRAKVFMATCFFGLAVILVVLAHLSENPASFMANQMPRMFWGIGSWVMCMLSLMATLKTWGLDIELSRLHSAEVLALLPSSPTFAASWEAPAIKVSINEWNCSGATH